MWGTVQKRIIAEATMALGAVVRPGIASAVGIGLLVASPVAAQCPSSPNSCFACPDDNKPGCADADCCDSVCAIDPFCCEVTWDCMCKDHAYVACAGCGDSLAGDCFKDNGSPGCNDAACCQNVCNQDPFCCEEEWDSACAGLAEDFCEPPPDECLPVFELCGPNPNSAYYRSAGLGDIDFDGSDDFAIGAVWDNPNGLSKAGRVYVYSGADYTELYVLDGESAGDMFGSEILSLGDTNGDGLTDFAVAAVHYGSSNSGPDRGRVYMFTGATGELLHTIDSTNAESVEFGAGLAGGEDVDNDGHMDLMVYEFLGGPKPLVSRVIVYSGVDASPLYVFSGDFENHLGRGIAMLGDVNGDGHSEFVIAEPGIGANVGRVMVYSGADGFELYMLEGKEEDESFGARLFAVNDYDGDEIKDFLVVRLTSSAFDTYSGVEGLLLNTFDQPCGDGNVRSAGDFNGDGLTDIVLGDWQYAGKDGETEKAGRAWIVSGVNGAVLSLYIGPKESDGVGFATGALGDINNDGYGDVGIGVPGFTPHPSGCVRLLLGRNVLGDPKDGCDCPTATPCNADLNGDGVVGPADLAILLGNWGPVPPNDPIADLNDDGVVGPADLAIVLGNWGPCP